MELLGITSEINKIGILQNDEGKNVLVDVPVFTETEKGIDILVYTLDRLKINYKTEGGSRYSKDYRLTRLKDPIVRKDGSVQKYQLPKGQGTYPFFHPSLIEKYEKKEQIPTIIITEGFFKAWKGCMHGIPTIGLSSITHMKEAGKDHLHTDIIRLIDVCKTKRIVWLTDGDCLDITSKDLDDGMDLYKRPRGFFNSCETFKTLLDDFNVDKFFFHIDSDGILGRNKSQVGRNDVKGLDDLLCAFPDQVDSIKTDILSVSVQSDWFVKHNITSGNRKILNYFHLANPLEFYSFHVERRPELKDKEFVFNGTKYKYDSENPSELRIVSPKDAKNYFRVGDQYYEFVHIPNKYQQLQKTFHTRQKGTIQDDHGKPFFVHIAKYKAFCNVPDHLNFQQVIHNCFNVYSPFEWDIEAANTTEEDFPNIRNFIKHVFGEAKVSFKHPATNKTHEYKMWELGEDYLQIMLQKPTEKLPILCLVSRENGSGKSTFGHFLKMLFTGNVAIVGNSDIAGEFNAHWAPKLAVVCDEAKIDGDVVIERVKALSTADTIMMNSKGKDHVELDCFIKFIFITNNEDNFIRITEDDTRYWVIKVPIITSPVVKLMALIKDEMPAFISYLSNRKIMTEQLNRMWFHNDLLKTPALKKVILNSQPTIIKELKQKLRDMFIDFGVKKILMTPTNIREELFKGSNRFEGNYLERVLKEVLNCHPIKRWIYKDKTFDDEQSAIIYAKMDLKTDSDFEAQTHIRSEGYLTRYEYPKWFPNTTDMNGEPVQGFIKMPPGRPYVFRREQFVLPEEEVQPTTEMEYINSMTPDKLPNGSIKPNDDSPFN